jgi:hypothetical protein
MRRLVQRGDRHEIKLSTAFVAVSVVLTVATAQADPQLFGRL